MRFILSLVLLSGVPLAFSQEANVVSLDLAAFCAEEEEKECLALERPPFSGLADLEKVFKFEALGAQGQKLAGCEAIRELAKAGTPPVIIEKKDDEGNSWTFRFQFGFSRTKYYPTDMRLKSSRLDVVVKDFEFDERTSSSFYNPANWEKVTDALRWIDEPSNTFIFSAEKNKNVFSLTVFHPKFLKTNEQVKHVTGSIDGVAVDKVIPVNEPFDGYNSKPGEMHLVRFENTHLQLDWQIGYGRRIVIFDGKKAGKLSYTPKVGVGAASGKHMDVYTKKGEYWEFEETQDKHKLQGVSASVGHQLEYQRGKVSVFVDQKLTASRLKHGFMDGKASYDLLYSPITFGVGIDLYKTKKKLPTDLD